MLSLHGFSFLSQFTLLLVYTPFDGHFQLNHVFFYLTFYVFHFVPLQYYQLFH